MDRYDELLSFDLMEDYYPEEGINEDGDPYFSIKSGKGTDDDGDETFENSAVIRRFEYNDSPFAKGIKTDSLSLNGNLEAIVSVAFQERPLFSVNLKIYTAFMWIKKDSHVYNFVTNKITNNEDDDRISNWIDFMNGLLSSVVLDGIKGGFEELTPDKVLSLIQDKEEKMAKLLGLPFAKPLEGQHTHLSFLNKTHSDMSLFGNVVINQGGTECEFESLEYLIENLENSDLISIFNTIVNADSELFTLEESAYEMARLFRVDEDFFDSAHDREQEILNGLIHKASIYNLFRSFAWTLQAFCEQEGYLPAALDFNTIQDIVTYISHRHGLNYVADSYSPAICSGDDLHVFFIPDSVSYGEKSRLLKIMNDNETDNGCEIRSLEALRRELDYMYPAIKTIYDALEADRDTEEVLEGGAADILYAWCSMTYAARQPFYMEDGPMSCWWGYPDDECWEKEWQKETLKSLLKSRDEWLNRHNKDLSVDTDITIKDKKFVFTGVDNLDEWLEILQKLHDLGGLERKAVSGKTNYLVCNPESAGESKIKHALEQRIKGKDVKIVLFEDFLKAIGMSEIKTASEKTADLISGRVGSFKKKNIKQVERPAVVMKEEPERLTYNDNLRFEGTNYVFAIPDGFVIKEGVDGKDFIAYVPDQNNSSSYEDARIVIYPDDVVEGETVASFRTIAEFVSVDMGRNRIDRTEFKDGKTVVYDRKDLPGCIEYVFEPGKMHVNALVGIGKGLQLIHIVIKGVNIKNKSGYESIAKQIIDHISATEPVQILKRPDEDEFIKMSMNDGVVAEWLICVEEHIRHLNFARAIWQKTLMEWFESIEDSNETDIKMFISDVKYMLKTISRFAEEELKRAESVYTLKRAQYPDSSRLNEMRDKLEALAGIAVQELEVDDRDLSVQSEYAKSLKDRLSISVPDAIKQILDKDNGVCSRAATTALSNVKEMMETRFNGEDNQSKDIIEERLHKEEEDMAIKFEKPTYHMNTERTVGTLIIQVPDNMIIADEYHSENSTQEMLLDAMRDVMIFAAIHPDYKDRVEIYYEAPFAILIAKPEINEDFNSIFDGGIYKELGIETVASTDMVQIAETVLRKNQTYDGEFTVEYVSGGKDYGIVFAQGKEKAEESNSNHFMVYIFHQKYAYTVNIYINASGKREEFVSVVKDWIGRIRIVDENQTDNDAKSPLAGAVKHNDSKTVHTEENNYSNNKTTEESDEAKKKAAIEKWEKEMISWRKARIRIIHERIKKAKLLASNEKSKMTKKEKEKYDKALREYNSTVSENNKLKQKAEETLSSLGVFSFSEKKAQKDIIKTADKKINAAKASLTAAEIEYKQRRDEVDGLVDSKMTSFQKKAEKQLPFPEEPEIPSGLRQLTPAQLRNERTKALILDLLYDGNRLWTVDEIIEGLPKTVDISHQRCCALLRQLCITGEVERIEEKRKAFFCIL